MEVNASRDIHAFICSGKLAEIDNASDNVRIMKGPHYVNSEPFRNIVLGNLALDFWG